MSSIPLSVSTKGIPAIEKEITAFPGSFHAMMPAKERTKIMGKAYQANSFLTGRRAPAYAPRTIQYSPARMIKSFVRVTRRIIRISSENFVHGLTREKQVCRDSA
jgi:hypothetical protein